MKERPIRMTPDNAQECFDGTKTQTRRIMKTPPHHIDGGVPYGDPPAWAWAIRDGAKRGSAVMKCPYGKYGDRLWVREACWIFGSWRKTEAGRWTFIEAQRREVLFDRTSGGSPLRRGDAGFGFVRRPSIHMPRWACRTVLEITEVRVERVQEISETDCCLEGCGSRITRDRKRPRFMALWESLNGPGSWERNDWVWVLSFQKV